MGRIYSLYQRTMCIAVMVMGGYVFTTNSSAADDRELIEMPVMMQEHMLANMRDHLAAITEISAHIEAGDYDEAGNIAEGRLGMSSLSDHGAQRMARVIPPAMAEIGTSMHRAASRLALTITDAELSDAEDRPPMIFGALNKVLNNCNACHLAYRIR